MNVADVVMIGLLIGVIPSVFIYVWIQEWLDDQERKRRTVQQPVNAIEEFVKFQHRRRYEESELWWTRYVELCEATGLRPFDEAPQRIEPIRVKPKVQSIPVQPRVTIRIPEQQEGGQVIEIRNAAGETVLRYSRGGR